MKSICIKVLLCNVSRAAITFPINCGLIFAIRVRDPIHAIKLTLLICGDPWNFTIKSNKDLYTKKAQIAFLIATYI